MLGKLNLMVVLHKDQRDKPPYSVLAAINNKRGEI
jgi:hypothetical protein